MDIQKIFNQLGLDADAGDRVCMQEPRGYQLNDLKELVGWKMASDFSEVGTGKSLKSYLYLLYYCLKGHKAVVVMPPPLIPQYMAEFNKIFPNHGLDTLQLNMSVKKRDEMMTRVTDPSSMPDITFMSYQMFVKYHMWYARMGVSVLVCDEAHAIKGVTTKNFKSVFRFTMETGCQFLEMTATPTTSELRDSYAHIRLKVPTAYPSLRVFDDRHTIYKDIGDFPKIVGYKDVDTMKKHLNTFSVRRRSVDVLSLKEPMVVEQRVDLASAHRNLYKKLLKERMLEMGDRLLIGENPQKLRQMALQIITNVHEYTESKITNEPVQMLKAIRESIGLDKKLLVFCNYRATVKNLAATFSELDPALMYGGSDVPKNVRKFNEDPGCMLAVANYRSGGAGFNLQEHCHNIVFFESTGVPSELVQAIGRLQRSGQNEVVNAWLLRYTNTISVRLIDAAMGRAKEVKYLMQDKQTVLDALMLD